VGGHEAGVRWAHGRREAELAVRQQYRCEAGQRPRRVGLGDGCRVEVTVVGLTRHGCWQEMRRKQECGKKTSKFTQFTSVRGELDCPRVGS
jgi:hypothetical protein